jgi:hypothetical protein
VICTRAADARTLTFSRRKVVNGTDIATRDAARVLRGWTALSESIGRQLDDLALQPHASVRDGMLLRLVCHALASHTLVSRYLSGSVLSGSGRITRYAMSDSTLLHQCGT